MKISKKSKSDCDSWWKWDALKCFLMDTSQCNRILPFIIGNNGKFTVSLTAAYHMIQAVYMNTLDRNFHEMWNCLQMRPCEHNMHANEFETDILVTAHLLSEVTLLFSVRSNRKERKESSRTTAMWMQTNSQEPESQSYSESVCNMEKGWWRFRYDPKKLADWA